MTQVTVDHNAQGGDRHGVNQLFRFRARGSLAFAGTFGAVGILLIVVSADGVPGPLATYIGGIGFVLGALIFIIGWGGAAGQSDLAHHATADHQRMYAQLDGRVGDVEDFEREQVALLGGIVDQVTEARRRRQGR